MSEVLMTYDSIRTFLDGMLCMMVCYALFTYVQYRIPLYWQYALYIICMVLNFQFIDQSYRDPNYRPGQDVWVVFFETAALVMYIRFVVLLMDIPKRDPKSFRLLKGMLLVLGVGLLIDILLYLWGASVPVRSTIYIANRYLLCAGGLVFFARVIRLRTPVTVYFITGTAFFLIGCLAALSMNFVPQLFLRNPANPFSYPLTVLEIGVVAEILCFIMGISLRSYQNERDKLRYHEQLVEQLQENERKQQKLLRIRDDIARDLHDDVGADLSAISVLSKAAIKQVHSQPEHVADVLMTISKTARRVIESMREIVWSLNSQNDSFDKLSYRMKEVAYALFEDTPVTLHLNLPPADRQGVFPADMRRDLFLIYKEALNNVTRHAGAQNVWVTLAYAENALRLTVQDDGVGFTPESVSSGNGLFNLRRRVAAINGTLNLESQPGKGTMLTVGCPVVVQPYELMNVQ
ncbi:hypothetical protein GCM10023189_57990 [Nibrella saemangeumensis]|uniref:Oxygen sensor histidine kinase NreB n=1 Tax=Nibrella saemangeumensis TaxID=1084526 RepID=A0ABP8NSC5_9BACT